jgi:DNA-binding transcriptional LysR family regulator
MTPVNLARLDLVSIRLALLCAELGSLSAAARQANCSVSTGSYRLSALEESFGTRLFTRDHNGLTTTAAGARFIEHATAIMEHIDRMATDLDCGGSRHPLAHAHTHANAGPYACDALTG